MRTNWLNMIKNHKRWQALSAIAIILLAGALIELMALVQYRYAHRLVEEELDLRAENELTLKSVRVRGMLKSNERMVRNYLWPIQSQIKTPEGIFHILRHIVTTNDDVMSSFAAFRPNHYPDRGRLFEPTAFRRADSIFSKQLASQGYDYTTREFYHQVMDNGESKWSDPYIDTYASGQEVVTYSTPLLDDAGNVVAAFGIDLSTKGIIDTLNMRHNQESTFFLLLTEDGKLISQPDANHIKRDQVDDVVSMINDSTCHREPSGHCKVITFNDPIDNSLGYIYYAFMKGEPHWQVVMVCYDNEIFSKLNNLRRYFLLLMLGAFTLLGFILYRFYRNIKRLHESKLSQERTHSELNIAQTIQSEMLPRNSIARPDVDVSGKQITAMEVGGDLYDYFIRDEKLFFCIGDVSGKGVPSSLVMAVVHSIFRSLCQHETNTAHIMQVINETACEGNATNMFVTLFIGILDLPTGRLRYCNAGHDAPLLIHNGVTPLKVNANLPVGLFDDFKYIQQSEQLQDGTTLFLYTDGLTEAQNPSRQLYGLQRIIDTAQQCLQRGDTLPDQLMVAMLDNIHEFAGNAQQSDDQTMLAIRYRQPQEDELLHKSITLHNNVSQVPELNNFVKSVGEQLNLAPALMSQLMLAVEEAVVNVMNYAYPMGTVGDITITATGTSQYVKFIIADQGKAFDPTQSGEVDTTLTAEERPIGGLGILLVRKLMDTINYERIDGKNVLTLTKNIESKNNNN